MSTKYTIKHFNNQFPDDNACLDYIFKYKYPDLKGYYRVKGRKCYTNSKNTHIYPLVGTIFENSSTSLRSWFYAMFLFSVSKNGVAAKEIERHVGVSYKTAWRMAKQIRTLMNDSIALSGIVEVDETYIGGRRRMSSKMSNKTAITGMVEKGGGVIAKKIDNLQNHTLLNNIKKNVKRGSYLMTDEWPAYKRIRHFGYQKGAVKHSRKQWAKGKDNFIHTNTIENFWGQLKRSLSGTYHVVSPKYLQLYVDEFAFRYNHQHAFVFSSLLKKIVNKDL